MYMCVCMSGKRGGECAYYGFVRVWYMCVCGEESAGVGVGCEV